MQLQTTSSGSKFSEEYIGVIFIQIDQHLKKLFHKNKGFPIFWNTVYILKLQCKKTLPPNMTSGGTSGGLRKFSMLAIARHILRPTHINHVNSTTAPNP